MAAHNSRTVSPSSSFSSTMSAGGQRAASALEARPSLDRIASRTEMRNHPRTPTRRHTTGEGSSSGGAIWDHMPSSPVGVVSPVRSEYIDFTKNAKTKRTLEWACAAARISDKEHMGHSGKSSSSHHHHSGRDRQRDRERERERDRARERSSSKHRVVHRQKSDVGMYHPEVTPKGVPVDLEVTDDESDEAITPPSTWGRDDPRWNGPADKQQQKSIGNPYPPTYMSSPMAVEDDDMMKAALALCGLGGRLPM